MELSKISKVNLVHRRDEFRGAQATVDKVKELEKSGKIKIFTKSINSKKRKIDRLSQLGSNKKIKNKLKWSAKLNLISTLQKYIYERKKYIF